RRAAALGLPGATGMMRAVDEVRPLPDAADAPALVELSRVVKAYGQGASRVPVLRGVSLTIRAGEFVAIVGASGSGKSTLMNILGCLDRPTGGTYRFAGRDVAALDTEGRAALRRRSFGFVFQQYNLVPTATAQENVELPAVYLGLDAEARRRRAEALLAKLGLADRASHRPSQLSGGQQQRVSIARALMNGGQVILADEPTGALDTRTGEEVMGILAELNRAGHTVIVITHDREVAGHARRVVEIRDGRIVADSAGRGGPAPARSAAFAEGPAETEPALLPMLAMTLLLALRAMRAHLLRTVLTLLGLVVGVGAVVTMLAVGDGARQSVMERMRGLGTNLLVVRPGAPGQRGARGINTLVAADAPAIAGLENVLAALPENQGNVTLRAGPANYQTQVLATTPDLPLVRGWPVAQGTFLTLQDQRGYATVAVLGQTVANLMFPDTPDPVGRYLLLNNVPFQVVGVLTPKGANPWGQDQDDVVMVPLSTGGLRILGNRNLRSVTVAVEDEQRIDETLERVKALLAERHGSEDFQIRNMASIVDTAVKTQDTLTVLLASIAAISLLVGGIGVMNIMLVTVTERTREIGIRLAIGARAADIRRQFLSEATLVSSLGGALGVAGGVGVAALLATLGTPVVLSPSPALLAFGCALATGLVFGYAPARKASRLDPIAALASE
ncbi:MAG TPA: MacB family efflux pump subunit, partial [Geminicoccaceae bacterium]